ncbi:hypothetical protein N7488_011088 [Penicillium malachiteum]|nr:hypothetical protein N7488_011088 [Penicillium malachiteum]
MASTAISYGGGNNYGQQIGIHNGPINITSAAVERPETPASPLSTVPFPRDRDFVSRDSLFDRIHRTISVPGSRVALVGLGGVGKSQLAIEYAYRIRSKSPATWVFWVHASNEARFEQGFRDIADQVKIPGRQDPKVNIYKLVENWLQDQKNKWICIIDNADDHMLISLSRTTEKGASANDSEPLNASPKPLLEYIPRSCNGSILITSRSKEVALKMVKPRDLVEVNPMERSEALELLRKILVLDDFEGSQLEYSDYEELVEELEFMPLAIVQAASYIRKRTPLSSVSQYLRDFRRNDREATNLLRKEAGHINRDWEAKNSILTTWQLSFEYIRHEKPAAADLLSFMSFFDRQGIPQSLIQRQTNTQYSLSDKEACEFDTCPDFEDAITTLRDYSFISISETNVFTIHRLVQLTTWMWLDSHGQFDIWKDKFIHNLWQCFPIGDYENWERCRSLFPHVKSAMSQQPSSAESQREWATLLYRGAWYALKSGKLVDALELASASRIQRVLLLGTEHEEATASTSLLAEVYSLQGRWREAEQLLLQVAEIRNTTLSRDHPDILTSLADLASTYNFQGRWAEAEQIQVQVMQARKTKLGEDHPDTLATIADLASTFSDQGRWTEAEQLELQVMESRRIQLGNDHPDKLTSLAHLASTYSHQGRWKEAEKFRIYVLQTRKIKLGEDHPDTLTGIADLASTFWDQGRWAEAETLEVQVMETRKIKLGDDHPDTLHIMVHLALTYRRQGQWKEAENRFIQMMEISKAKLGSKDHPDILNIMAHLALTYNDQGRWEEAEQLLTQVIEMSENKLGKDHPFTLTCKANLASTYSYQDRWKQAELLEVQVMETRKLRLSEDHPDTLSSIANLASTYAHQSRWQEAEHLFIQLMKTSKAKLGEGHPDTLSIMAHLALMYSDLGRWEEAKQLQMQVTDTRQVKLGYHHPDTLASMADLAFTWKFLAHDAKAIDLLSGCLARQKQTLGLDHPTTLANSVTLSEWD